MMSEENEIGSMEDMVTLTHRQPIRRRYEEAFDDKADEEITHDHEDHIVPEPTAVVSTSTVGEETLETKDKKTNIDEQSIPCQAPSCLMKFKSNKEFQKHYNLRHMHVCGICKKSLPSSHILELHVLELHDTFFSLVAQKKPMYECFLETCRDMFENCDKRKAHCMEVHNFPEQFKYWEFRMPEKKNSRPTKPKNNSYQHKPKAVESGSSSHQHECSDESNMVIDSSNLKNGSENATGNTSKSAQVKPLSFGHAPHRAFRNNVSFGASNKGKNKNVQNSEINMDLTQVQTELLKLI